MSDLMYPVEVVTLPSQGKFYPKGHPLRENGGQLELKYMTAKEEDILTSTNLIANGTVMDRLVDSLVVHKGVKPTDLTTGDLNAVLIASRVLAYGKEYPLEINCDKCESKVEHVVDLSQLESPDFLIDVNDDGHHEFVTETGLNVVIKPLTRGDEMDIENTEKILSKRYSKGLTASVTSRLKQIIVSINGVTDKSVLSGMIENLVVKDSKLIKDEFDKINPSIDMTVEVTCDECGHTMKGGMPIGLNFFWPDIEL